MDDNKNPIEIPDNNPESNEKPIMGSVGDTKHKKKMKAVKYAYAFAVLLALGGALAAKIATENALGELNVPIESDYVTINEITVPTEEPDFEVRQNLDNVPDTREESTKETTETKTEPSTVMETTSPYATPFKDTFFSPTGGKVINNFENSKPVYNEVLGEWRTHPGADYKASEGGTVTAIAYGTVQNIYEDALYGTVIEIDHGNSVFARYCGLNKDTIEVKAGDTVKAQQALGFLGEIAGEDKETPHLHLEVVYEEKLINPAQLIIDS